MIELERITSSTEHIRALYKLLESRSLGISHRSVPDFEQHKTFVETHPYRIWYLIKLHDTYIGSTYLKQDNTIGINVEDAFIDLCLDGVIRRIKSEFEPLPEIKSVRSNFFVINVSPSNQTLMDALEMGKHEVLQVTYKI